MDTQTPTGPMDGKQIDPSILTTQQLWREVAALKELMLTRMEAIDKAVEVAHTDLVRVPTEVQKAVSALERLHDEKFSSVNHWQQDRVATIEKQFADEEKLVNEKFAGVEKQFSERDVRVEQTAKDTKVAVDAALAAQEKAVSNQNKSFAESIAKSETATTKQIDQQAILIDSRTKGLDDKITDVKDRLGRIEQLQATQLGQSTGRKDFWGYIVGAVGLIAGIIAVVISLSSHVIK